MLWIKKTVARPHAIWLAFAATVLVLSGVLVNADGRASGDVDVLLVIALDVSASVDDREFDLQREGLARALASPQVAEAVKGGANGSIAVTVVQWSGFTEQEVKVPWTRVSQAGDLARLAESVRAMSRRYNGGATDIGGALTFMQGLFATAPQGSLRRVIDIAGDGPNNVNHAPHFDRDIAVAAGTLINALVIVAPPSPLPGYFRDLVIGGPGAFVEVAADYETFEAAMRRKLIREIGGQLLF